MRRPPVILPTLFVMLMTAYGVSFIHAITLLERGSAQTSWRVMLVRGSVTFARQWDVVPGTLPETDFYRFEPLAHRTWPGGEWVRYTIMSNATRQPFGQHQHLRLSLLYLLIPIALLAWAQWAHRHRPAAAAADATDGP